MQDTAAVLATVGACLRLVACTHRDSRRVAEASVPLAARARMVLGDAVISAQVVCVPSSGGGIAITARFRIESGALINAALGLRLDFSDWSTANYLLVPAAVYNGNRYPRAPASTDNLRDHAFRRHDVVTVSPVPRLHPAGEPAEAGPLNQWKSGFPGGPSRIQLLTGDCSAPMVGVHMPATGRGLIVSTGQGTRLGDTGITIAESADRSEAGILLKAPGVREEVLYQGRPSRDRGADLAVGDDVELRMVVHVFPAADVPALFAKVFAVRSEVCGVPRRRHDLPFAACWALQERKYNRENWVEREGYYSVGMRESPHQDWQTGWVGGTNAAYPLIVEGDAITLSRAMRVWDFVAREARTPSGFVKGCYSGGRWHGDTSLCYMRYSADSLYFLIKTLVLLAKRPPHTVVPQPWLDLARGLCDAFARQQEREGRLVHYCDATTGETVVGGSCAAGIAPAGLAMAARYFHEPRYLTAAIGAARAFRDQHVVKGVTNGGPGDIFQCIDSESAAGLLDSFTVLWEETGEREWLDAGVMMAHQAASWTMPYDFSFPATSTFGRLDMLTTGTVWANIQNKHSAPGICTLSGDSLLKIYRGSGDRRILELLRGIAHAIPQFLSRADRPIVDVRAGKRWPVMPEGWMNERVNTSDWEVRDEPWEEIRVGEIFGGSCWCEATMLLTYAELPGIYLQTDTLWTAVLDHVVCQIDHASPDRLVLAISNPTRFDARVKLLAERSSDCTKPLGPVGLVDVPRIAVPAGSTARYEVAR